jgi:hypothetical protein
VSPGAELLAGWTVFLGSVFVLLACWSQWLVYQRGW